MNVLNDNRFTLFFLYFSFIVLNMSSFIDVVNSFNFRLGVMPIEMQAPI